MKSTLIELKKVVKKFGKKTILNGVNLTIKDGDILGLIGVSGSGKTTILNIIIGFLKTSKGSIIYNKQNMKNIQNQINQTFGFASQAGSYYNKLSVVENLEFFGRMYNMKGNKIKARTSELLGLVDLSDSENKLAKELSTGMQRRLDIACALMHSPKVLILDEPTEDLDPMLRKELLSLIKKINKDEGTTILLTSHLLGEIEFICNQIAILNNGRIHKQGSPMQLKNNYSDDYEISIQTLKAEYKEMMEYLHKKGYKAKDKKNRVVVYSNRPEVMTRRLLRFVRSNGDHVLELSLNKPSLEEIFEKITRKN